MASGSSDPARSSRQTDPSDGQGQTGQPPDVGALLAVACEKVSFGAREGLLVVPHNDPDPDAIASACALCFLLSKQCKIRSRIVYCGIVGRAENKALVRYLGHPLQRLVEADLPTKLDAAGASWHTSVPVALVDTQPGAGNVTLPPGAEVVMVIDHHPRREETAGVAYADVRTGIGATSTILTEYLQVAGLEPPKPVATALFYGIKTDTMGLSRSAGPADVAAYLYLQSRIDVRALARIENARVPASYFRSFDSALRAARVYPAASPQDSLVIAYLGPMDYPGLAPEMADFLLRLDRALWVACMGIYRDHLLLSIRSRSRRRGAEHLVLAVVGDEGTAGGHGAMAAGQIPLAGRDPHLVAGLVRRRILDELEIKPDTEEASLI